MSRYYRTYWSIPECWDNLISDWNACNFGVYHPLKLLKYVPVFLCFYFKGWVIHMKHVKHSMWYNIQIIRTRLGVVCNKKPGCLESRESEIPALMWRQAIFALRSGWKATKIVIRIEPSYPNYSSSLCVFVLFSSLRGMDFISPSLWQINMQCFFS